MKLIIVIFVLLCLTSCKHKDYFITNADIASCGTTTEAELDSLKLEEINE